MKKNMLVIALVLICSLAFAWDIVRQATFPTNFYSMEKVGETVWAVGYVGGAAKSYDDGLTWTFMETPAYTPPTYKDIWDVAFIDDMQGIIVGDDGMIALTTDGGATWNQPATAQAIFGTTRAYAAVYHSDGKIWVCGYEGKIAHSSDHGQTWVRQGLGVTTVIAYGMSMNEQGIGFVALNNTGSPTQSKILKTTDFGDTWTLENLTITGNPTLYRVRQFGEKVVITGNSGYLGFSNDNGDSWTHYPNAAGTTTSDAMRDVIMEGDTGYAVGRNNRILKTTDGWQTYELVANSHTQYFEGILYRNNGTLLTCGWQGALHISENEGITWTECVPSSIDLYKASAVDENNWYLAGDKGYVIHTADGGSTFERLIIPGEINTLYSCHFKNAAEGFVSGKTSGKIYHTYDGGQNWESVTIPGVSSTKSFYDFYFLNDEIGYIVGLGGKVAKTTDGGNTWNTVGDNINSTYNLYCTYWKSETQGYAGSGSGRLFITNDGGITWTNLTYGSANIMDIWFKDDNSGVFVTAAGAIYYTNTGGDTQNSWIAANEMALDDLNGITCDQNGVYWAVGFSSNNTSTNIGNSWSILRSIDGGATWTEENFPSLTFNSTRFMGITFSGGRMLAYGRNNVIVAQWMIPEHVSLVSPANNSININPASVLLQWTPASSGSPAEYYSIFLGSSIETLFDEQYFETEANSFDLAVEGNANLGNNTRWFWAVLPVNNFNESPDPDLENFMVWQFTTMAGEIELTAPELQIQKLNNQVRLYWNAVENANSYRILGALTPNGTYTDLGTTNATEFIISNPGAKEFYKVIADTVAGR